MDGFHTIRLRGPWEVLPCARTVLLPDGSTADEPLSPTSPLPEGGKQQLPDDWSTVLGAEFRGRVRYQRRFHRPSNLAAGDRVELLVRHVDAWGTVALNDTRLGAITIGQSDWRCDVTRLLQPGNLLTIEVELPRLVADSPALPRGVREGLPGGLVGEVCLRIFPAS